MSIFKSFLRSVDPQVSTFTKILHHKRGGLRLGPNGSAQGIFYQMGLDGVGDTQSPEATLASIMKKYVALRAYDLDSQISVIECRVFGLNCNPSDPTFESMEAWVAWRLPRAFKKHSISSCNGWDQDFYRFAKSRVLEHFA